MPSSCIRTGASNPAKSLAFSIERIMAKGSEPHHKPAAAFEARPSESPAKKLLSLCSPLPGVIPVQPLPAYEMPSSKALLNYSELWKGSLRHCGAAALGASTGAFCKNNCGACCKGELPPPPPLGQAALPGAGRVIKPQVIHQTLALPANGSSLYYFNCLDSSAYHPSEILQGQLFASGLLHSPSPAAAAAAAAAAALSAHQKLFLLENAKLAALAPPEKFPNPQYPHKERLPGQLDQVMKENSSLAVERPSGKAHHAKLGGGSGAGSGGGGTSADGKPKNFTCEVCGKVRGAFPGFPGKTGPSLGFFSITPR